MTLPWAGRLASSSRLAAATASAGAGPPYAPNAPAIAGRFELLLGRDATPAGPPRATPLPLVVAMGAATSIPPGRPAATPTSTSAAGPPMPASDRGVGPEGWAPGRSPGAPAPGPPRYWSGPTAFAAPGPPVEHLADEVIRAIDRRVAAARERLGKR